MKVLRDDPERSPSFLQRLRVELRRRSTLLAGAGAGISGGLVEFYALRGWTDELLLLGGVLGSFVVGLAWDRRRSGEHRSRH